MYFVVVLVVLCGCSVIIYGRSASCLIIVHPFVRQSFSSRSPVVQQSFAHTSKPASVLCRAWYYTPHTTCRHPILLQPATLLHIVLCIILYYAPHSTALHITKKSGSPAYREPANLTFLIHRIIDLCHLSGNRGLIILLSHASFFKE